MAEKIKLGIIADAGAPTGFATVTHNLTEQLLNTGDYDIQIIGINFDGQPNEWSKKYNIWPARLGGDLLGVGLIPRFINEVKPDAFLLFQDFWHLPMFLSKMPGQTGTVLYYPVDSPNIKGQYMLAMSAATTHCVYTKFGADESLRAANESWGKFKEFARANNNDVVDTFTIEVGGMLDPLSRMPIPPSPLKLYAKRLKALTNPSCYTVIPHGIDVSKFMPINKKGARKLIGVPIDAFVVGNVNRNQSRKRQDLTIRAFADFAKDKPNARLVLHCVASDAQGWDLEQLGDYYGCLDKMIFTHMMFKNSVASTVELNYLYNSLDVQINTGGGEGWGLTSTEGAACKVPQIVPNWSATKEIWEGHGKLIDVISVRHEPGQVNTMQAVIDTKHLVQLLNEFYESPSEIEKCGEKCFEVTQRPEYKWENVGKQFDDIFKKVAGTVVSGGPIALTTKGQLDLKKKGILT